MRSLIGRGDNGSLIRSVRLGRGPKDKRAPCVTLLMALNGRRLATESFHSWDWSYGVSKKQTLSATPGIQQEPITGQDIPQSFECVTDVPNTIVLLGYGRDKLLGREAKVIIDQSSRST